MSVVVGIDVAKEAHWAVVKTTEDGETFASRRVENTPEGITDLITEIMAVETEHGACTVGIDMLGGMATLLEVMLIDAGLNVVHVPGLAVNRARRGTTGGEHKSDPKDATVIADQVWMRNDLRTLTSIREEDAELRLLVGRRSEIVADQTRRAARIRDLLSSIHPALETRVDPTTKTGLWLLTRYVTPAEIRRAGHNRILGHLRKVGHVKQSTLETLADAALETAHAQTVAVPGERVAADLIREMATEAMAGRDQLASIDWRIEEALQHHPESALIRSLPGMGATLTAEFLAVTGGLDRFATGDKLAAAAGLAPVLKQSGKVRYHQRATSGDKTLKRVFYQSAFVAIGCDLTSKTYYQRKRTEGKTHHQAVLALARRRVNVLHAIIRNRTAYNPAYPTVAT